MWNFLIGDSNLYLEQDRERIARKIAARVEAGTLSFGERKALKIIHLAKMQRRAGEAGSAPANPILIE